MSLKDDLKYNLGRGFNWPGAIVGAVVALVLALTVDHFWHVSNGAAGFWIGAGFSLVCINVGRRVVKRRADS